MYERMYERTPVFFQRQPSMRTAQPSHTAPTPPSQIPTEEKTLNRELSWLEFNRRVIEQARDEAVPLLERLRFICIASTNLDEFFEARQVPRHLHEQSR